MKFLNRNSLIPFLIATYFCVYAILPGIVGKEMASFVKTGLLAFIIIMMIVMSETKNYYASYMRILIPCFTLYFLINLIFWESEGIIRWAINVISFFVFYKYSSYKCFFALSYSLKIATLICTLSVVYYSYIFGSMFYFRDDALIDKSYLTAFYAMTYFFCIIDILYERQKSFNIISLLIFVLTNIFIVQSKTSLLALLLELIILYLIFPRIRAIYNKYIKYVVVLGCFAFVFLPTITLPQELTYGINRVLGFELLDQSYFTRSTDRLGTTFDVRDRVRDYCFNLFSDNPVFGIGQGNFKVINNASSSDFNNLTQTESSWLQILTEGGLFYLFTMIFFFFKPMSDVRRILRKSNKTRYSYYYLMAGSFFLVFSVMYLFNDFADSLFWLSAGIMTSLIACDKTKVPPINSIDK